MPGNEQRPGVPRRRFLRSLGVLGAAAGIAAGIGLAACQPREPQERTAQPKDLTQEVYARQLKILMDKGLIGKHQLGKIKGQTMVFSGANQEWTTIMWKAGVQKDGKGQFFISTIPTAKLEIIIGEDANSTVQFGFGLYDLTERHYNTGAPIKEKDLGRPNDFINSKGLVSVTIALSRQDAEQLSENPAKR